MSKYYVNKFLYQVDRDPELLAAYKADPLGLIERWETDYGRCWVRGTASRRRPGSRSPTPSASP
ncbi:MAG: hypothetical protein WDM88_01695 [Galbitalea sp.]